MSQTAKAQEPSMEEILASIRRIIADDETKPPAPPKVPPAAVAAPAPMAPRAPSPPPAPRPVSSEVDSLIAAAEPPPPAPEVLDLTESMAADPAPPAFRTIDGRPDVVFAEPNAAPEPPRTDAVPFNSDRLLSGTASAAVDSAFNSLAQTVLVNNARTLEDLVREILRPMLKSWLDDNLPGVVERLVRAEIERVSRGRS
jgi:cell pole-organizing protein PopZ